ncbi:Asp23/Gls24 family envelope stress response protein [Serpentinicella sp. ANB-PHB4]|uniref:Asp23/Gls24 family envelope stress response protein n=1 Tax=Serpentinicella sp. ANB-PHB4 TaxID=3074076 RepID=UPI0028576F46|nr:Asp23/Gls24 family envelope stress response protein [Serpentinicella sp. ANB-PHB4]MDR5658570.1 Asp23/Gls24 family envelope stress response protein [Serpentinicella sp. ANB-PHB4]
MKVIVLVGPSGTGKSYQAMHVASKEGIAYIIDDGLLIRGNKVLGGISAKKEKTKLAAVRRALFSSEKHCREIRSIIRRENPVGILIIGTSDKMVNIIVNNLKLGEISKKVYIHDIVTKEDMQLANRVRKKEGKHVIPVPTFEIKKHFSGYFLNPLEIFRRNKDQVQEVAQRSVVRPTFSYLGRYTISDRVIRELIYYTSNKIIGIYKIDNIQLKSSEIGIIVEMDLQIVYGNPIRPIVELVQERLRIEIEEMTSLNVIAVNVFVKSLICL